MKSPALSPKTCSFVLKAVVMTAIMAFIISILDERETLFWIMESVLRPTARAMKNVFTTPYLYVALTAILAAERFMPAKHNQKILSVGFAQDTMWFFFDIFAQATVIAALASYWQAIFKQHFSFLTIHAIEQFPFWLRFLIAVVVADFAGWLHHYMRHKIWWMWPFHAIHHSQKELNAFTAVRYHLVEYLFTASIYVFFFGIFTMNPHTVVFYSIFYNWYTKMTHANIKSNFGILRYVLVTPQSHRIHHSFEERHLNKNLGIVFSVWDYMFGTQYRKYDEYPDSGIDDDTFPHEQDHNFLNMLWILVKQHLYPFQALAVQIKQRRKTQPVTTPEVVAVRPALTPTSFEDRFDSRPKAKWEGTNRIDEPATKDLNALNIQKSQEFNHN